MLMRLPARLANAVAHKKADPAWLEACERRRLAAKANRTQPRRPSKRQRKAAAAAKASISSAAFSEWVRWFRAGDRPLSGRVRQVRRMAHRAEVRARKAVGR